ncbi:phosphatidate cytidylyltransferase [Anaerophaga thermohalophila]|uniref:phosphatidate cytidylyltransferase n=1 Tax=Anaerophaga thermohalophila TaxID=177400 RepID=UPI000237BEFA|nr:phosphatidate cytidylyltransferase [Anaerophaga thermohalophila]
MIKLIYIIILIYFLAGGIGFYFINRNKDRVVARKSYTKFGVYFIIINILFFSIIINPVMFKYIAFVIIGGGLIELFSLHQKSGYRHRGFFLLSLLAFVVLAIGLYFFSRQSKELILFSFLVVSIFDSFSQITGQLWGTKKIFPEISPNKTLGGLTGGALVALGSAILLRNLYWGSLAELILVTIGIIVFAFAGDMAASYYKRRYNAKDFSNLIPGHGGILDRFDSLIAGGAWISLCAWMFNL